MTRQTYEVAVVACSEYSVPAIKKALRQAFHLLSYSFAYDTQYLLKPNLLMSASPEQAVTTHPAVIEALLEIIREDNACALVGDSPGYGFTMDKVKKTTGMQAVCDRTLTALVDLGQGPSYLFDTQGLVGKVPITRLVKSHAVISVPKVKTSRGVLLTCAVKNLFGCVCGEAKSVLHTYGRDPETFYSALIHICNEVAPVLTVADGIMAMEGNGPDQGTPIQMGYLFVGVNPYAVDFTVARSLSLNPAAIGLLRYQAQLSGEMIRVLGIEEKDFPILIPKLPRILSGNMHGWGRPVISDAKGENDA